MYVEAGIGAPGAPPRTFGLLQKGGEGEGGAFLLEAGMPAEPDETPRGETGVPIGEAAGDVLLVGGPSVADAARENGAPGPIVPLFVIDLSQRDPSPQESPGGFPKELKAPDAQPEAPEAGAQPWFSPVPPQATPRETSRPVAAAAPDPLVPAPDAGSTPAATGLPSARAAALPAQDPVISPDERAAPRPNAEPAAVNDRASATTVATGSPPLTPRGDPAAEAAPPGRRAPVAADGTRGARSRPESSANVPASPGAMEQRNKLDAEDDAASEALPVPPSEGDMSTASVTRAPQDGPPSVAADLARRAEVTLRPAARDPAVLPLGEKAAAVMSVSAPSTAWEGEAAPQDARASGTPLSRRDRQPAGRAPDDVNAPPFAAPEGLMAAEPDSPSSQLESDAAPPQQPEVASAHAHDRPARTDPPSAAMGIARRDAQAGEDSTVNSETYGEVRPDLVQPVRSEAAVLLGRAESVAAGTPGAPAATLAPQVAAQLAAAVTRDGAGNFEVRLSPEELGAVRLSLHVSDGAAMIAIQAERPETLDLMRRHVDILEREFRDAGFTALNFSFGQGAGDGRARTASIYAAAARDRPDAQSPAAEIPALAGRSTPASRLDLRL